MSKVIYKLTGEDIVTAWTYTSGTYAAANKENGQNLGYEANSPETIVKRDAAGKIVVTELETTDISSPVLGSSGGSDLLGFFDKASAPIVQPVTIAAPVVTTVSLVDSTDGIPGTELEVDMAEIDESGNDIIEVADYITTRNAVSSLVTQNTTIKADLEDVAGKVESIIQTLKNLGLLAE